MYYRRVEIVDGETTEPAQFVGVHPLVWHRACGGDPTAAFVESDEMEKLLRKIRGELDYDSLFWPNELIDEIDALLGDEANG